MNLRSQLKRRSVRQQLARVRRGLVPATIPRALFIGLILFPFALMGFLQMRLWRHRQRPRELLLPVGFRWLRPDQYTPEGQVWLRRAWLWYILILPWILGVVNVFRTD